VLWGGALLRQAPSLVSAPLAYRWPQTLYVTHRAEKYADVLAALYGMLLDNIPWDNERALIGRLPGQEFPSSCNPRMPLPHCPDVLAWDRAAHIAPYVEGLICVVTGAVVGAFLGAVIWRDGVHAIAKVPVRYIPEADWTFEQIFVDMNKRAMMRAAFSGFRVLVVAAQEEVRQRQADPQGPEPDEHTPLLAQPEGNGPVNV
jgi:hypothetical protein